MRTENISPKVNSQYTFAERSKTKLNSHARSFGSAAAGNAVIGLMDAVDRGGLVASFLIQDFCGMNLPRTATGLYRNKDITGQYNYQEAAEVAIREFMSGPTMFAIPMLMLWGIKRLFGKANDVPIKMIRAFGTNFEEFAAGKSLQELSNIDTVKSSFYENVFKNVLKNTYKEGTPDETIASQAKKFASDVIEYEQLKAQKKTKKFFDKIKGKKVPGTAEDKLSDIVSSFSEINKSNAKSASSNFLEARLVSDGKPVGKSIDRFVVDMRNFIEDISSSVAKQAEKGNIDGAGIGKFVKKFTDFRCGSRALSNLAMIVGTISFCSIIPKLYQLSDKNPALNGLEPEKTPQNKADDKNQSKKVAFGGAIESLGKKVSGENWLSKLARKFEFEGYNMSYDGLLTVCGLGVLLPRLYNAREENEYKEVLCRDTITILTVAGAAKILQKVVAAIGTKATGLALAIRPDKAKESPWANIWAHMKPVTGTQVLNSSQLYSKYTNIDKYNGGIVGFAKFIDEQGGNISKSFNIDKTAKGYLKELYDKSAKAASVAFENAKNADIIEALDDVVKNKKADEVLNKLYTIFKDDKNVFLRKAKVMNSSFNFALLFFVAPVLLGYVIPVFNEMLTKKRQFAKNHHEVDNNKTKVSAAEKMQPKDNKTSEANASLTTNKTFSAFQNMINR